MGHSTKIFRSLSLSAFSSLLFSAAAFCHAHSFSSLPSLPAPQQDVPTIATARFDVSALPAGTFDPDADANDSGQSTSDSEHHGLISRSVRRVLEDHRQLYKAPFKISNLKWDALALGGTAVLLIEDRNIENKLPGTHYQFYQDTSNIAIGGLSATLAGVWIYGIKTGNQHARETGVLELETLVNTFLIYTPMQLIAGRQRPQEGNGHGDFLRHHGINTSFPGGHAMFTWAMATVVAHEYSQPWVQVLAYTAAFALTSSRFLARDHWASDMWLGSALGMGIGAHIFHSRCDPDLSASCKHDTHFIF